MRRNRFIVEGNFKDDIRFTENYRRILLLLQRRRYLPTKTIAAATGIELTRCRKALEALRHDYGLIDARWAGTNAFYQEAAYLVNDRGYAFLKKRGLFTHRTKADPERFRHELGVNLIMASIEIGARKLGIQLLDHHYLLQRPECPSATRQMQEPFILPVTIDYDGHKVETEVEADGDFLALQGDYSVILPGFEFDRRTEPLEPNDYDRPSIKKKFLAYRQLVAKRAYEKRFGFEEPNYLFLYITINTEHMHRMMAVLERITEGKPSSLFGFMSLPNFATFESFPPPDGFILTQPIYQVGHPPLILINELTKGGDLRADRSEDARAA
jgi:hypothetical protein